MNKVDKIVIGIDEAGRGPLAGPVSVAAVCLFPRKKFSLRGLKDSKKLSQKKREFWYKNINDWQRKKRLAYFHTFVSASVIDRTGISRAISQAVKRVLKKSKLLPSRVVVLLDGGLRAPAKYLQKTTVRGDEQIKAISLASIIAKVKRDRFMILASKVYPMYRFDIHKGYGTLSHRKLLKKYGKSPLHRVSFCRK